MYHLKQHRLVIFNVCGPCILIEAQQQSSTFEFNYLAWDKQKQTVWLLVFESSVPSGFLMPKGFHRNRNRSALSQKSKDRTGPQKDCRLQFFAVFRPISVFIGFNQFMTGL